jgi:hypothetical protein
MNASRMIPATPCETANKSSELFFKYNNLFKYKNIYLSNIGNKNDPKRILFVLDDTNSTYYE